MAVAENVERAASSTATSFSLREEFTAVLCLMIVGVFLAIEPHLAALIWRGTLEYVADEDEVFFLALSRAPFFGGMQLRDPFCLPSEHVPALYSGIPFVPLAWLTRMLGLPLVLTGLVWRVVGGAALGVSLYVVFRRLMGETRHPRDWALGCGVICLSDAGFVAGRWFARNGHLLQILWPFSPPPALPNGLPQYGVVTPLLSLPVVLLLLAMLHPKSPGSRAAMAGGAITMGICVSLDVFLSTVVIAGIGLYLGVCALLALLQPAERSACLAKIRLGVCVVAGGVVLGLPRLYQTFRIETDPGFAPILQRLSHSAHVCDFGLSRLYDIGSRWEWGAVALAALLTAGLRLRGLGLLWCTFLAAFALENSALVTRLNVGKQPWGCASAVMAEILFLCIVARAFEKSRNHLGWLLRRVWLVPIGMLAIAGLCRPLEALKAESAAVNSQLLAEQRPLRAALGALSAECSLAGPKEADVALLFSRAGQLYQEPHTAHTSLIPDREVNERHALNAWLMGFERADYSALARPDSWRPGKTGETPEGLDEVARTRLAVFDSLEQDGAKALLARYRPCALLLPTGAAPPHRSGSWSAAAKGPRWTLWQRQGAKGE